jgi:diguanylate cyclase (GGDEF)-like protein
VVPAITIAVHHSCVTASLAIATPRLRGTTQRRVFRDPHVLLGIAIATSAAVIEAIASPDSIAEVAASGLAYVAFQIFLSRISGRKPRAALRLLIAVVFVAGLGLVVGPDQGMPLGALNLAIVAMAAAYGRREGLLVGVAACTLMVTPVILGVIPIENLLARGPAVLATMILLAIGTRQTVGAMEQAVARARTSIRRERRRARQMAGVEAVGRLLALDPSGISLERAMDVLVERFGYSLVSIYLKDDDGSLVLGAQRGYDRVVERFDGTVGVVGRVMRTGVVQHVPDVRKDPDYRSANEDVLSELSAPLFAGGDLIGVINLEDPRVDGLDDTDRTTLVLVAERLAGAIALGRDRQALTERAERFTALSDFARRINSSLDPREAYPIMCEAIPAVIAADVVVLTLMDAAMGDYRIAAMSGPDQQFVGRSLPEGEGTAGVAIAERRLVVDDHLEPERYASTLRSGSVQPTVATLAVPLLRDTEVLGAITLARLDLAKPFSMLDREVAPIVAGQVALAIANARLHTQVADAAIRDPLTGLANRRHLDAALERLAASRERLAPEDRRPLSAILFDLDHFGAFNKRHGLKVGDTVLRTFGSMLSSRFRASDIVARYGGEEFLVILDGASLDEARRAAEDLRVAFAATPIEAPTGRLAATVSAGCSALGPGAASVGMLLEVADVALQMAKRSGRNQVVAA